MTKAAVRAEMEGEMAKSEEISGIQKAAILLIALGPDKSSSVFKKTYTYFSIYILIFVVNMFCTDFDFFIIFCIYKIITACAAYQTHIYLPILYRVQSSQS